MNHRSIKPRRTTKRKPKSLTKTDRTVGRIKAARITKLAKAKKTVNGERQSLVRSIAITPDPKLPNNSPEKKGKKT